MIVEIIGYAAGIIAMVSFLPQFIKTLRTKKANDISIYMLILTLTTNILYIIYGILLQLYPIIIMIGIMTCIIVLQIIFTIKYKKTH
jgi:MtN3 and saliva related transmembrane protein